MSPASAQADTAECPFCQREVDSDLVAYGGKCPHCFGEIPGEEAPTDPGEAKKKEEHKRMAAQVQRGRTVPIVIASMLLFIPICGAMILLFKPAPKLAVLNLDEGEFALADVGEIVAIKAPVEVAPVGSPDPKTPVDPKRPRKDPKEGGDPNVVVVSENAGTPGGTNAHGSSHNGSAATPGVVDPTMSLNTSGQAGGGFQGVAIDVQRREVQGVMLQDDNLIIDMVKKVVGSELPKLRYQCYEPLLKRDETLTGAWVMNFVINPNGSVKGPTAAAKPGTTANAELEACIAQKLTSWRFQPIKAELPVTKSVAFRPS